VRASVGVVQPDPNREAFLLILESLPILGNRFSDIKRLGPSGGTGQFSLMFSARDAVTRRKVALKVFHPGQSDAYRRACFRREQELLQRYMGKPDVIQMVSPGAEHHESVQTNTGIPISFAFHYYALELAELDLGALLATDVLDHEDRLLVFRVACRAVQRLHTDRVAHRDIKPPNFLQMRDRSLKVSDLGTARDMRSSVPALVQDYGMLWPGDVRYTPPEMFAGLFGEKPSLGFGADFYALGATLFEMFAGVGLFAQVFDRSFVEDLLAAMQNVRPGQRQAVYDAFVSELAAGHPLPDISRVNPDCPACIRDRLNELYRDLCALDYRRRLTSFTVVFRRVQAALLCYRNERRQRQRLDRRRHQRIQRLMATGGLRQ